MAAGSTPAARGFRMPAEWERHRATWLSWPHNPETWPGAMPAIPPIWAQLVAALAPGEEVQVLVAPAVSLAQARDRIAAVCSDLASVHLHPVATNDAWMRDTGPTFVVAGSDATREVAAIDWRYNAWGGKYPPWEADDRVARWIAEHRGIECFSPGIVLEGGSIEVNGAGTLITTESCLLNPNRNPELSRGEIETVLREQLGVEHFIWLGDGIVGDDTDGHVDDITRFVAPAKVVTVLEDDAGDANYWPLRDNLRRLEAAVDQDGTALEIVSLPMPDPVYAEGERLPASYANFYIGNEVVVVPTFRCARDEVALETLQGVFPDRRVVGIDAVDLVRGLGAFHCITQQEPV